MADIDFSDFYWRKSSRSSSQPNCVEVAFVADEVATRDSKDRAGGVLLFPGVRWQDFLAEIRGGSFEA